MNDGRPQSWSLVVFCYNEIGTVHDVTDRLFSIFEEYRKGRYEMIIVDDGSSDGSWEAICEMERTRPGIVRTIRHERNLGIGRSLIDGYMAAQNENVAAIPADGQFDVRELIPYLNVDERTFVSFYRIENLQYTKFRTVLSAVNRYINSVCNGVTLKDVNWVKIYKREAIMSFPWAMRSSIIESEICAKLLAGGNSVVEVLSYYHPRRSGKSKGASLKIVAQALRETLKLILVVRKFKKELKK